MLLVDAEIRQSEIHGIGLFSVDIILKGTRVWEFNPLFDLVLKDADVSVLPAPVQDFLKKYAYRAVATNELIVNVDLSKHMNHSDTPNLISDADSNYFAAADIFPGTELTCDYREFSIAGCDDFLQSEAL